MLAGDRFTDRPRSVSPVVAALLRCYNDGLEDDRRQDLYRFAAAAVGTRDRAAEGARLEAAALEFGVPRSRFGRVGRRFELRAVGRKVLAHARTIDDRGHARFLAFVDRLIAVTSAREAEPALAHGDEAAGLRADLAWAHQVSRSVP
jgi:hypothetical protein